METTEKSAERMVVKSTNRSRNGSDLCVRQPTDQKAGGSNPSRRTKRSLETIEFWDFFFRFTLYLTLYPVHACLPKIVL